VTRSLDKGFVLGNWKVVPDQCLIVGQSGEFHLEPKVMELLVYLAHHQDEVVKRDTLLSEVWQGVVVGDEALSRAVSILRAHLGDSPKDSRYVQTIPKVGYRLVMPVELTAVEPTQKPAIARNIRWGWLLVLVLISVAAAFFWRNGSDEAPLIDSPANFSTLTDWFDYLATEANQSAPATSIAVLPFETLDEDNDGTELGDGLTDELTISLSKIRGLKVVARRSSYSFRNRNEDVPTIGRLLNVDAVFEGSIRVNGEHFRINALLSDAENGYLIWSDVIDTTADGLYDTQAALVAEVVGALRNHFADDDLADPQQERPLPDQEAYRLYLMSGNHLWQLRGERPLRKSIELYREVLELDPSFSRATIGLAKSLVVLPFYSEEAMQPVFQEVESILAGQKFSEPREQGEVEAIRAFMAWNRWQWIEAEERFRRSLQLAPDLPNTYQWYSQHLSSVGHNSAGLESARRARELDEVSPVINDRLGVAYLWKGDTLRAAEHFAISAQLGFRNAINPGYMILLLRLQRFDELKNLLNALLLGVPQRPDWLVDNLQDVFRDENREQALEMARQVGWPVLPGLPRLEFGLWILLGANDEAYRTFDAFRDTKRQYLQLEFVFTEEARPFREDPRFEELAREIGWRAYWDQYGEPETQ